MPRAARMPLSIIITSVLLLLASTGPYLSGNLETPEDSTFLGFRYMAGDHYQYGSFVRQTAQESRFFYRNLFTTDTQREQGSYVFLFFTLVGLIQQFTGLGLGSAWELTRIPIAACWLLTIWVLCGRCFVEAGARRLAFFFVTLSGGLSWLAWLLPGELFSKPGGAPGVTDPVAFQWNWNTFSVLFLPLWILPLLLLSLSGLLLFVEKPPRKYLRMAVLFLLGAMIWFIHPYSGNAAYLAVGFFALAPAISSLWKLESIDWNASRARVTDCLPYLASFGLVVSYLIWARSDPVFLLVSQEGLKWSPSYSVFLYPITYGLLVPLSALGMRWSDSMPVKPRQFIFAWLGAALLLSVNPYWAGVKHQYLVHAPLALFSAHGLLELRRRSPRAARLTTGLTGMGLALLLFINGPFSLGRDLFPGRSVELNYLGSAQMAALKFLEAQPRGAILSAPPIGNLAPMFTGKRVYVGHWVLTNDARTKEAMVSAFFNPRVQTAEKQKILDHAGIDYIYYGPDEQQLGRVDPLISLQRIYKQEGVTIYRVPDADSEDY